MRNINKYCIFPLKEILTGILQLPTIYYEDLGKFDYPDIFCTSDWHGCWGRHCVSMSPSSSSSSPSRFSGFSYALSEGVTTTPSQTLISVAMPVKTGRIGWWIIVFELDVILAAWFPQNEITLYKAYWQHRKGRNNQTQTIQSITNKFHLSYPIKLHYHIFNTIMNI